MVLRLIISFWHGGVMVGFLGSRCNKKEPFLMSVSMAQPFARNWREKLGIFLMLADE